MKNITLAIDEELIEEGRRYARDHHTSLNGLIRNLLARTVRREKTDWADSCIKLLNTAEGHSSGKRWNREDLYDV